ncbi:tRNA lysidine(34) synthetase TilS [Pseudomonas sp. HR96]|uniref:tRNA lysidine(34) synthetase TilS n=1 Tax=Pseudomonas sp. HR96 TaxID=1027966 RepID=UPI002A750AB1|nr:tRNA lysidine(34) synthetase TilS [Pseudomonas sp. HR96]WPP01048.1 tRNA lysidine(34) synthetase TilS [Pseudomonas sp. HR96]
MLEHLTAYLQAPRWHVAFSGGLDSTVLLHQLAQLSRRQLLPSLHAIHVHHGLQAAADAWPAHCQTVCDGLGIPLTIVCVKVQPGASLEQAARDARYQAFCQILQPGELLLTAQHRDDQAETLLFRLLRGSGVRGLAGMPRQRPLGQGTLLRPLLEQSRGQLERYAHAHGLSAVEDPSNGDLGFARNYLRHAVLPTLRQRWPQATATLARTSEHLREALELLEEVAGDDLRAASTPSAWPWLQLPSLALAPLRELSAARQRNALQTWLAARTRLPDARHWQGWENLRDAAADAAPHWVLGDGQLQRGAERLWWLSGAWLRPVAAGGAWPDPQTPLQLADNGTVRLSGTPAQGRLSIGYRQGGETLLLPSRGRRDLKRLLNEAALPGFVRSRLPLLFIDGQLHAVANLGLSASAVQLHWTPPTNAQRLR